jgi:quinol monooxygenase YgiN
MIIVMGHATLAAGELERLDSVLQAQIAATNAAPGCDSYSFARDVTHPDRMIVSERWHDQAAIDAHFASAHMAAFNEALGKAQVLELSVKSYNLSTGEIKQLMGG